MARSFVAPDSFFGVAPVVKANSVTVHGPAGDEGRGPNNMWKDETETENAFLRAVYDLKHTDTITLSMISKATLETWVLDLGIPIADGDGKEDEKTDLIYKLGHIKSWYTMSHNDFVSYCKTMGMREEQGMEYTAQNLIKVIWHGGLDKHFEEVCELRRKQFREEAKAFEHNRRIRRLQHSQRSSWSAQEYRAR